MTRRDRRSIEIPLRINPKQCIYMHLIPGEGDEGVDRLLQCKGVREGVIPLYCAEHKSFNSRAWLTVDAMNQAATNGEGV
jgi:hypothetical protein